MLPAAIREPEGLAPAKPASPPAIVKPCAYQGYRKMAPTGEPKAATPSGHPKGAADRSGPWRAGPADTQRQTRRWVPNKGSARPPAPPIPKPATGKAAPAPDPKAGLEPPASAPTTEAGHEPSDTGGTQTAEPGNSQGFSKRVGGERMHSDWFDAHPEWKATARRPSSLDPNRALKRILDLRTRDRHVGAEPNTLMTPFHLKGPAGAKEFYSVQRVSPL